MKTSSTYYKKIILSLSFFVLVCAPLITFAQQNEDGSLRAIQVNERSSNQNNSGSGSNTDSQAASSMASCLVASGLVGLLQGAISDMVSFTRVPTSNSILEGKDTGTIVTAGIAWDQIGWCLVNSLIESISAATVEWINSGFEGNPAFVADPSGFFANLADVQAGQFINELSGGFLCQPIQNIVRVNLATSYNRQISPYGQQAQCTFSGVAGNLEQFMSGETFSWDDWLSYTQNPYNNPLGATMLGQIELDSRIAGALGVESTLLDWGAGFFSVKDKETGQITSPGKVIEDQINQRLFSGQRRLEIADEFNEVVTALFDQLIKMAVSEVTQGSRGGSGGRSTTPPPAAAPASITFASVICTTSIPAFCDNETVQGQTTTLRWTSANIPATARGTLTARPFVETTATSTTTSSATNTSSATSIPVVISQGVINTGTYTWRNTLAPRAYILTLTFGNISKETVWYVTSPVQPPPPPNNSEDPDDSE